jgi:rhodanese-related sulfurtransferase/membrane protein insertase Oxa1/YidC/SpoIIIJ/phosphohistidine swiveling domain-containing protein
VARAYRLSGLVLALTPTAALAIPSPELVISSLSSLSQIFTMLAAMLGGGAAIAGAGMSLRKAQTSRRLLQWAGIVTALAVISVGFNVAQWLDRRAEHQARLEANLLRPSRTPGMPVLDPTLKELSFSQQTKHPLAISTADAQSLLQGSGAGGEGDVLFLDIRETVETEMGSLPGAGAVRGPDLPASGLSLTGRKVVMFCHNGNRSSENCQALAERGIDCRFVVGGLEKWLVEGRPMSGLANRTLDDLRAIAPYPNQRTLLDTARVHELVQQENALFVDLRYPGELAAGHLPGAVNLPMRRLSTVEIRERISQLPHRPIVAPCYDRRSCFFGEVLGLELHRSGRDFRGRYTVPHEYFVAGARPPHVEQWIAESQRSWWGRTVSAAASGVAALAVGTGLPLAILLIALLSRLLVLPLSLKAERDQITTRALDGELAALKARLRDDPVRYARALQGLYRRHGLTPVRNLLAMLFLPIMTIAVGAIHEAAVAGPARWLWVEQLDMPDPFWLIPLAFGILIAIYLHIGLARTRRQRWLVWTVGLAAMTVAAGLLSAAAALYLVISAILLLLQRAIIVTGLEPVRAAVRHYKSLWRRWRLPSGVIALADVERLTGCGNKAYRLALLKRSGLPVPDGIVLTVAFLQHLDAASPRRRRRLLSRLWRRMRQRPLAVRSSAAAEDGANQSFAGVFESVLDVDRGQLDAALKRVVSSFSAQRVTAYESSAANGNVLLQNMVDADYAGVLFTRDPAAAGSMLIELVRGSGEALVSGRTAPEAYRFGRISGAPQGPSPAPIDLTGLIAMGRRAESLFEAPQDIEWTWRAGAFQIVQSRNITALLSGSERTALVHADWTRVLERTLDATPTETILVQNELCEQLPRPTPLSLSMMERMWEPGGSVDLACRRLSLQYRVDENAPSYLTTVAGRLYIDRRQMRLRAPTVAASALRRIERSAESIAQTFRETFLPAYSERVMLIEAIDTHKLADGDLARLVVQTFDEFNFDTHVEISIVNIAAALFMERARTALVKHGLDPATWLAGGPPTHLATALAAVSQLDGAEQQRALMAAAGHRATLDHELCEPRYSEQPHTLTALLAAQLPVQRRHSSARADLDPTLAELVKRAHMFQTLKEDAKHHGMRQVAALRRLLLALDARVGLDGLIFFLTLDDVRALDHTTAPQLKCRAARRRCLFEDLSRLSPLPQNLDIIQIERAASKVAARSATGNGVVGGQRVSGSRVVSGRAVAISPDHAEQGLPVDGFLPGDILVTRLFHPNWLPLLNIAGGIVCELGGWLSHMAILARERDVAMIVGVPDVSVIADGAQITLETDGRITRPDAPDQPPVAPKAAAASDRMAAAPQSTPAAAAE